MWSCFYTVTTKISHGNLKERHIEEKLRIDHEELVENLRKSYMSGCLYFLDVHLNLVYGIMECINITTSTLLLLLNVEHVLWWFEEEDLLICHDFPLEHAYQIPCPQPTSYKLHFSFGEMWYKGIWCKICHRFPKMLFFTTWA